MKHPLQIIFTLLFLTLTMPLAAETVTVDEARRTAVQFLHPVQGVISDAITLGRDGTAALYVFNRTDGGYVIVSADDCTSRRILGYSDSGSYDPHNVSSQLNCVLDGYIEGICRMRNASEQPHPSAAPSRAVLSNALASASELPSMVEPLLGDIAWGQNGPYNGMVPTYVDGNGVTKHFPAGCEPVALAQIMMYHRWPENGRGSYSYEWKGQTLSADFSSSEYRWDLMIPDYSKASYTQEQADAVALLMHDIGIALNSDYHTSGSGASFNGYELTEFFDYDRNICNLSFGNCTVEEWESVLRSELAAGRPVICTGDPAPGAAGHMFVCDGYDGQGLFHFNFGWDGNSNGWFASNATGWETDKQIYYGIEKNHGGKGNPTMFLDDDFLWVSGNTLRVSSSQFYCAGFRSYSEVNLELGLALENVANGEISYCQVGPLRGNAHEFTLDEPVPDGSYHVYMVGRVEGQEWNVYRHDPIYQSVVDLDVTDGVKTWTNGNLVNPMDDGVYKVDNLYYLLDIQKAEATVTTRNKKGDSYSGAVTVPDEITVGDKVYKVTSIGEEAFSSCSSLNSVSLGKNVRSIDYCAFYNSSVISLSFAGTESLSEIGSAAFQNSRRLAEIVVPDGTCSIGARAFQGCHFLKNVAIPASVNYISSDIFNGIDRLETIHVAWTSFDGIMLSDDMFGALDRKKVILYVPEGTGDMYRTQPLWSAFDIREENGLPDCLEWSFEGATGTLTISGKGRMIWSEVNIPWADCSSYIRNVVIGEGIVKIPERLFLNLKSLESVTLPASLETIDNNAFAGCSSLSLIRCHASQPLDWTSAQMLFKSARSGMIIVPKGSDYSLWQSQLTDSWEMIALDNVDVESRGFSFDFDSTTGLLSVEGYGIMPKYYNASTGSWNFLRNDIRQIELSEGISVIPRLAFGLCSHLESVRLPESLQYIGYSAFDYNPALKEITCLAKTAPELADEAFCDIASSGRLVIPDGADYSSWLQQLPSGWNIASGEPEKPQNLYIVGSDGTWNPAQASALLTLRSDGCHEGNVVVSDAGGGYGYFCIGTVLDSDWNVFNANRLGAPYSDCFLNGGDHASLIPGFDASFKVLAGTHHIVVDLESCTISLDCSNKVEPVPSVNEETFIDLSGRPVQRPMNGQTVISGAHKIIYIGSIDIEEPR